MEKKVHIKVVQSLETQNYATKGDQLIVFDDAESLRAKVKKCIQ